MDRTICRIERRRDLALNVVEHFDPLPDTHTHVLADSWYVNKRMWKAVKQRRWDLTGGLKANHKLRTVDIKSQPVWIRLDDFAEELATEHFQPVLWPSQEGGLTVYAYLVRTRVKKLGACQVLVVKPTTDASADKAASTSPLACRIPWSKSLRPLPYVGLRKCSLQILRN